MSLNFNMEQYLFCINKQNFISLVFFEWVALMHTAFNSAHRPTFGHQLENWDTVDKIFDIGYVVDQNLLNYWIKDAEEGVTMASVILDTL